MEAPARNNDTRRTAYGNRHSISAPDDDTAFDKPGGVGSQVGGGKDIVATGDILRHRHRFFQCPKASNQVEFSRAKLVIEGHPPTRSPRTSLEDIEQLGLRERRFCLKQKSDRTRHMRSRHRRSTRERMRIVENVAWSIRIGTAWLLEDTRRHQTRVG